MPSFAHRLVVGYLRVSRRGRHYRSPEAARARVEELRLRPPSYAPPKLPAVELALDSASGWPVYTLTPTGTEPRGAVVYLHGGGWVNQIDGRHYRFAAGLAAAAATRVVLPVYPKLPNGHAIDVVEPVADLTAELAGRHGAVCLGGDSAGGQIALSAALVLRDRDELTLPRTILISPALDLTLSNPEIDRIAPSDPWLKRPGLQEVASDWAGELPLSDPRVSPLAGELGGLGPLSVFCGTRDIVLADTRLMVEKARRAGVDVDFHEREGLVHVYPLLPTPEGAAARRTIAERVREAIG